MTNNDDCPYIEDLGIETYDPAGLLDHLIALHALKDDTALSRFFGFPQSSISNIRNGKINVSTGFILKCHEIGGMTVAEVRAFIGGAA